MWCHVSVCMSMCMYLFLSCMFEWGSTPQSLPMTINKILQWSSRKKALAFHSSKHSPWIPLEILSVPSSIVWLLHWSLAIKICEPAPSHAFNTVSRTMYFNFSLKMPVILASSTFYIAVRFLTHLILLSYWSGLKCSSSHFHISYATSSRLLFSNF